MQQELPLADCHSIHSPLHRVVCSPLLFPFCVIGMVLSAGHLPVDRVWAILLKEGFGSSAFCLADSSEEWIMLRPLHVVMSHGSERKMDDIILIDHVLIAFDFSLWLSGALFVFLWMPLCVPA